MIRSVFARRPNESASAPGTISLGRKHAAWLASDPRRSGSIRTPDHATTFSARTRHRALARSPLVFDRVFGFYAPTAKSPRRRPPLISSRPLRTPESVHTPSFPGVMTSPYNDLVTEAPAAEPPAPWSTMDKRRLGLPREFTTVHMAF